VASGAIFTMLGRALKEEMGNGTRTAAWLTLFNTAGAMIGSLVAGFVLLPWLGIEKSLFVMIVTYGLMALLIPHSRLGSGRQSFKRNVPVFAIFFLSVILYPFGSMADIFLGRGLMQRFPGTTVAAVREGLTETAVYLEYEKLGQPYFHRLLTNSYSMSATDEHSSRYMKLFTYLPVAIRPNPEHALLISYGVGNTARALVETDSLTSIDIVDISRDIMELSEVIYPDPKDNPLNDQRVKIHVEDGRFFLQVTEKKYDLITGEPPPPTVAGVVNLYTQEYFGLIRDRLAAGGMTSYWLPGHSLEEEATKAIIKAFCNVFEDCSLWAGAGLDWILLGSRDASGPAGVEAFSRQWKNPRVADELRAIGVENPGQLGALFMADAEDLKQVTEDVAPVVDAFPYRILLPYSGSREFPALYAWLMDAERAAQRFAESGFVGQHWPDELVAETLPYFYYQRLINRKYTPGLSNLPPYSIDELQRVLVNTSLESLPLWMMGSSYYEQRLIDGVAADPQYLQAYEWGMARRDIAERRFTDALQRLERLRAQTDSANRVGLDRLYLMVASLKDYRQ
jgi:spermidine synthase